MKNLSHSVLRRTVSAAAIAIGVSSASAAWALDMNDIMNLQAAGLDANTMVTVIRSSTEPLTVTPAEVEQLRAAGIPAPVLDEICLRVGCGAGPAGPAGPGGPGGVGPNLQQEMERQRQAEEERRRLEMQRMEEERQRMREEIERQQQRETQVQDAFQGLTVAERAYRQGNYVNAARTYRAFLDEVAPAPGSVQYNEALIGFVRSMHAAGFRYAIRVEALEAALIGPTSQHFEEVFGILSDIANEVSYLDPQFERLTGFQVGNYDQAFQDDWNYFIGRFFWVYGDYQRASEYLSRVTSGSERAGQAHYLRGVIAVAQQENRRALSEFQSALDENDPEVAELANLAIARLAYSAGGFDIALYYYRKVPFASERHARAVFETAWTYTLKQDWNRAIGTLHSLHSPYYDDWFFPELYVLEGFAYLETCNLDAAQEAILAYGSEVASLQEPLQAFIAETAGPDEYWQAIATYYDTYGTPQQSSLPIEAVRAVLSDVDFYNQYELIQTLEEERERLGRQAAELGEFGALALSGLESDIQFKTIDAGLRISAMLNEFDDELLDWNVRAQELGIEIRTRRITAAQTTLEGSTLGEASASSAFVLAEDWQYWPFEGEYWVDEVDAYRGDLPVLMDESGRCVEINFGGDASTAPTE